MHVYPIPHFLGQFFPFAGKFHNIFPAFLIVIRYTDTFSDRFFGDAQFLFYSQFHGQAMSIPTCFPLYIKSLKRFITADHVFNCPGHYMMNTRHTVCRRRSFVKYERGMSFPGFQTHFECLVFFPSF